MQELESGIAEAYDQILQENDIIRDLFAKGKINRSYLRVNKHMIDNTVAVIPKNGIIKTEAEQELESGDPSKYDEINQNNIIWRDLILKGKAPNDFIKSFKRYGVDVEDLYTVGVVPKDGIMKTEYLQTLESGIAAAYEDILRDNHILRNGLLVSGEYKIKTSYFYRHLLYKK
jgi:hypothetical protein